MDAIISRCDQVIFYFFGDKTFAVHTALILIKSASFKYSQSASTLSLAAPNETSSPVQFNIIELISVVLYNQVSSAVKIYEWPTKARLVPCQHRMEVAVDAEIDKTFIVLKAWLQARNRRFQAHALPLLSQN